MNPSKDTLLIKLEANLETLRRKHGISACGEIIFQAPQNNWSESDIVVESDGRGGAKLLIVEGNYPSDFTTHREQAFDTEEQACKVAEELVGPP
jgi:hypothetical protein